MHHQKNGFMSYLQIIVKMRNREQAQKQNLPSRNAMNDTAITLLELLAQYKFLCVSQFETLGIDVSRKALYDMLKALRGKRTTLIGRRVFAYHPKF